MFAERLKELRKEKQITQEELAKAVGVARTNIGKYEGKWNIMPSYQVLHAIADYFDVSIDYLLGREDMLSTSAADPLRQDEKELLADYNKLNRSGKEKAREYISDLTENNKYRMSAIAEAFAKAETKQIAAHKKRHR